jgi:RNA polymerase sigma-70 factor (ECF subfamily)
MIGHNAEMILGALVGTDSEALRLRNGDLDALAGLMERYQHRLYRYLLRIVCDPGTAEDLFQQTWLRVMQRIQKYDPQRNFEGWLFSVAHNIAIDYVRRRRPQSLNEPTASGETQSDLARSADTGALDQLLSQEREDWVLDLVASLPLPFREIITLRFEEEMKLEEIATTLALPIGTVKTRLHRAMKALRQLFTESLKTGKAL